MVGEERAAATHRRLSEAGAGVTWALREIWREQERYHMPGLYPHDCHEDAECIANVEWFFRRWLKRRGLA